jgi:serine/threonine protein kinase
MIDQMIDRYKIVEKIGEGGMAIVYQALDTLMDRTVALKVIRPTESPEKGYLKRFEREARALARLNHPNIVHVLEYGEHEGQPFLVMDYVEGGTLMDRMGSPMPAAEAVELILPIAKALGYAHKKGIVHRDVKPGNILFTASGDPMLTDFGLVKLLENEESVKLTRVGTGVGTPEYSSPEQCFGGTIDPRADIYSLGIVFYELVTGRKPFSASSPREVVIKQSIEMPPKPRDIVPEISADLEKIILKALEKKPSDRFPDMASFADGLLHPENALPLSNPPAGEGQISQPNPLFAPDQSDASTQILNEKPVEISNNVHYLQEKPDGVNNFVPPGVNDRRKWWIGGIALVVLLCLAAVIAAAAVYWLSRNPDFYQFIF